MCAVLGKADPACAFILSPSDCEISVEHPVYGSRLALDAVLLQQLALDGVRVEAHNRVILLVLGHRRLALFKVHGRAPSPRQRRTRENARVAGGRENKRTHTRGQLFRAQHAFNPWRGVTLPTH